MRYALVFLVLFAGCAPTPPAGQEAGRKMEGAGTKPPVIEAAWAPETARQGRHWRIYLKAADPECDAAAIYVRLSQLGFGDYPLQQINLPASERCGLAGQLSLWLGPAYLWGSIITAEVWVQDGAGNASAKRTFKLTVDGPAETEPPAEFRAPEFQRSLGTVNVRLRSPIFERGQPGLGLRPF